MKCIACGTPDSMAVVDSRPAIEETVVRRRRKCRVCHHRITTYEANFGEMDFNITKLGREIVAAQEMADLPPKEKAAVQRFIKFVKDGGLYTREELLEIGADVQLTLVPRSRALPNRGSS